jgi:CrcB protein
MDDAIPIDPDVDVAPVRARPDPRLVLAVAAGGAIGGPTRYGLSQLIVAPPGGFPWATFWTNVSGSLVLGFALIFLLERFRPSRYLRLLIGTGFCGAYTTFSTFSVETDVLVKDGHALTAVAYVVASLVAGLAAVVIGMTIARRLPIHPDYPDHPEHADHADRPADG